MRIFSYLIFTIFDIKRIRSTKKGYNVIILTNRSTIPPGRIKVMAKQNEIGPFAFSIQAQENYSNGKECEYQYRT
jgi:hypothetical protein